jgi:uracil-DNA glycosylase
VLGPANGPASASLMFVGEAPGRLGAARTGVPLQGDESGRRFGLLLAAVALRRDEVLLTNAVLCLPLDATGRNRRPTMREVDSCTAHLAATIEVVDPRLVVALGAVALSALAKIEPHGLVLRDHAGTAVNWNGRMLAALYHPSRQAELHRAWESQLEDWRRAFADKRITRR